MKSPIVLLSDFGSEGPSMGLVKAAILRRDPGARIVDYCHDVPPRDIWTAAYFLMTGAAHFPKGSLFVTMVASGEGLHRRLLWCRTAEHQFLLADNACISWLAAKQPLIEIRHLGDKKYWSPRADRAFPGRDIFGPVAGSLSRGLSPSKLGKTVRVCDRMPFPSVVVKNGRSHGTILAVDGVGNAITNFQARHVRPGARIRFRDKNFYARLNASSFFQLSIRDGRPRPGDPVSARQS